jgi:hypothetical protein
VPSKKKETKMQKKKEEEEEEEVCNVGEYVQTQQLISRKL